MPNHTPLHNALRALFGEWLGNCCYQPNERQKIYIKLFNGCMYGCSSIESWFLNWSLHYIIYLLYIKTLLHYKKKYFFSVLCLLYANLLISQPIPVCEHLLETHCNYSNYRNYYRKLYAWFSTALLKLTTYKRYTKSSSKTSPEHS